MRTRAAPIRVRAASTQDLRIVSQPCEVIQQDLCRTWNQNLEPEPGTRTRTLNLGTRNLEPRQTDILPPWRLPPSTFRAYSTTTTRTRRRTFSRRFWLSTTRIW